MNSRLPLRVFVADDEAPARKKILRFLSQDPTVTVVGEAGNGPDALRLIQQTRPDLLFLDVQMPGMDGFAVVNRLQPGSLPRIVFVTAHDEYAIQAFDVHAFGYLLKPFDQTRFAKVLSDAKQHISQDVASEVSANLRQLLAAIESRGQRPARLLVQQKGRAFFLSLGKIDWARSERNYLNLHVANQTYTIRGTIESLEEKLPSSQFLRLNRSCLVRIEFIRELQSWTHGEYRVILQSGETLPWTRRYLMRHPELLEKL